MSSLQKFHRRTNGGVQIIKLIGSEAPVAGAGFYMGLAGDGASYMYVAPKSTEVTRAWGSAGTMRSTTSVTDGLTNTNTLFAFGSAAHPAAYYCRALTTGGYNTWYLPANAELNTLYLNKWATPFATSNGFPPNYCWSSTEATNNNAFGQYMVNGNTIQNGKQNTNFAVRAVRRSTV